MARNIGVKNAIGDIIITAEPEVIFVTDVITQMLTSHEKYPNEIISAGTMYFQQSPNVRHPLLFASPKEALRDCLIEEYQTEPRSYRTDAFVKTKNLQATWCALYEKKWLMDLGGWDEGFPGAWGFDDIELCTRLRINGINQYIDQEIECIHQWHPHLPPHIQGPAMVANENFMKDKKLNEVEQEIVTAKTNGTYHATDERLIANKGKEWGIIIPKPV